jgi:dynein heavy chain
LERPTIKRDFESKYGVIAELLEQEMDSTKKIFDRQVKNKLNNKPVEVHRNLPEVSGLLKWCHELRERIQKPMQTFDRLIDHPIKDSVEMLRVRKKYEELLHLLEQFVVGPFKKWCDHVGKLSNDNLEKNLLSRDPKTKSIKTNFDPQLVAVIREVKYLELLKEQNMPEEAKSIFQQNDQYISYITSLDYTVDSYNKIFKIATAEEMSLINIELQKIDADIEKAEKELKWKSSSINEYIIDIRTKVSDLETRLQKTKLNVEKIQTIMSTWKDTPLFKRYESKSTLLQLDDKQLRLNNRYKEIEESGKKIHELINENKQLFKEDDEQSENWKSYVSYVDKIVVDGFHKIILCSLTYFLKETDHLKSNPDPFFEAQLLLKPPEMVYTPSLHYGDADGFYELIEGLVGSIYKQGSLVQRLAKHLGQENYQADLDGKSDISEMRTDLMERVNSIMAKANEFKDSFNKYAYLWVDDRKEFMRQFLLYNHVLTQEEIEAHADHGVPESPPTLEQFKEQVDTYEHIYDDVGKLEDIKTIEKWFRVDNKPFKQNLLNTVKKWSFMFKQHLMDDVTNSLKELDEFIKEKDIHLAKEVKEGDYTHLVHMMGQLGDVREKTTQYDGMFDPIKNKIELLKTYGQEVPDDVYEKLQVILMDVCVCILNY